MRDSLSDLVFWLRCEFRDMTGSRSSKPRSAVARMRIQPDGITIEPVSAKLKTEAVIAADAASAVAHLQTILSKSRHSRGPVAITIGRERYLTRSVSEIRLPKSKLEAMARLDVQAATPFSSGEVHIVCHGHDGRARGSGYRIVKRSIIDPLIQALKNAKISISEIGFAEQSNPSMASVIQPWMSGELAKAARPPARSRLGRGITTMLGVFVAVAAIFSAGHAYVRYSEASASMDNQISAAQREARAVRGMIAQRNDKINQITMVREQKQSTVPVAVILEEMARIIPDSSWLTSIAISGNTITFTGLAKSAASLIPRLEGSPLFKEPTFKSPVVRANNRQGEQYTITMEVEAGGG